MQVNQGSQSAEPSTQGDRGATGARYWQPSQHRGNKQVKPDEVCDEEYGMFVEELLVAKAVFGFAQPAVDRRILASRLAPVVCV